MGKLQLRIVEASNVPNVALFGSMEIYCKVRLDLEQWFQTGSVQISVNPKWTANNVFEFHIGDENSSMLHFELWNKGVVSDDFLGSYSLGLNGLFRGVVKDDWYLLQKCTTICKLRLRVLAVDFGLPPPAGSPAPGRSQLTPPPSPTPEPVAVAIQPAQPGTPPPPPPPPPQNQPVAPSSATGDAGSTPTEQPPAATGGTQSGGGGGGVAPGGSSTSPATTTAGGASPYSSRPAAEHRTEPKPYQTAGTGTTGSSDGSLPPTTSPRQPGDSQNPPRPATEAGVAPPVAYVPPPPPPEMPLPPPMEHTTQLPIFGSAHAGCPAGECIYVIQPKIAEASGRILGVLGGGRINGTNIAVTNPNAAPGSGKPAGPHQQWLCQDRGIGYVSFVPLHGTNSRLDSNETAPGARIGTNGAPCVWESTDPRLASQCWRMEPMDRGYFKIHRLKPEFPGAADADLVLEVEGDFDGAAVKLSPAVFGAPSQLFRFHLIRTR